MTGNGKHTTYKNYVMTGGWFMALFYPHFLILGEGNQLLCPLRDCTRFDYVWAGELGAGERSLGQPFLWDGNHQRKLKAIFITFSVEIFVGFFKHPDEIARSFK